MRMVIGFGAGARELRVKVQKYQAAAFGLRRIADAEAEAKGSKMPALCSSANPTRSVSSASSS